MGYYDQHVKDKNKKQKGNRGGYLIPTLIGLALAGFIVLVAFPNLFGNDRQNLAAIEERESRQNGNVDRMPAEVRNVSVNVSTEITEIVDGVAEAVVGVINIQHASFWQNEVASEEGEAGTGSGVIYKKENGRAYVVTNYHVIEGATTVEVSLVDGTRVPAEVLGEDPWTDLAVLVMEDSLVTKVATFGNSDNVRTGEPVIAIGNPLGLQFSGSVTQGIISGTDRSIPVDIDRDGNPDWHADVMQTDAAINPGNSGGALVNIQGQVIGVNSMKIAQEAVEGIGLSIPANTVIPIINDLEEFGEVQRPYFGVSIGSLADIPSYHWQQTLKLPNDVNYGVYITNIAGNSPASRAGLQQYDVIVELDGDPIYDVIELRKHLYNEKQVGEEMNVTFYRGRERQNTSIQLTESGY
ncbi:MULTISPECIES: S1C family serine protease [Sutcliffiella]|uniref:Serine protease n=1 Tax=Sutcliffiella cohnii TaxID=33932 RepID=A0A223KWQ8_9BACI|nr:MULTISPECIES: S1C family serine protease [Sutcliffiella]AST93905.1 serine protease [Sutcliffiella cohnii]WBL15093.1 S1C family serine protease [Sutcliffiella sp. NC1]